MQDCVNNLVEAAGTPADAPARDVRKATVCQVLHSLNVGGAEVLAARLARRLSQRYKFLFACLDELGPLGQSLRADGYQVEVLERRPGFDRGCARLLRSLCRDHQVDLLHAHQYTPFSYAVASGLVRSRPPVLFTEHGRWYPDLPRPKRIVFNRLFLRRRDRVVAVGDSVRQALISNEGIPASRIEVVYNGIDPAPFQDGGIDRSAARRQMGVGQDDFVVIQIARLDALKDHLTAIRTIARVVERRPDARLVLVGEGPEQATIENEVARRKMGAHVRLLGLKKDVAPLLRASDAFLLTSVSEGIPLTIIEAMAAGLPVVSTQVGGVGEVVLPGETGWLAPSGDDEALAAAIVQIAEQPELAISFGQAGRRRAVEHFSEERNHQHYCRIYQEMLGG